MKDLPTLQRNGDEDTIGMIRVVMRVVKGEIEGRWHSSLKCKSECSESGERRGIGGWNEREEKPIQAGCADGGDDFARIDAMSH